MKTEQFTIYQESCGAIMLKGFTNLSRIPIALSYEQIEKLHYPIYSLPHFDTISFYHFYSLPQKLQKRQLDLI